MCSYVLFYAAVMLYVVQGERTANEAAADARRELADAREHLEAVMKV